MSKNTNFTGQPIFGQILQMIKRGQIHTIARKQGTDRYYKKFTTYKHLVTMLYLAFEGCTSIREVTTGLLACSTKLFHLGMDYSPRRSTLSDANKNRNSSVFQAIYMKLYRNYASFLSDSRLSKIDLKRLFIVDSTTISLFKAILKGAGRKPKDPSKQKGGIKAHTMINAYENVPCLIRYSAAAKHDHTFLKDINLPEGSYITFDKAYNDYIQYKRFTEAGVWFVTLQKENAIYELGDEYDIPDDIDDGVIKDEEIYLSYKEDGQEKKIKLRRVAYWADDRKRLLIFISNNFELPADLIALIYKKRWQIETLFKQLKQNFPLKYFLGDNVNAIEIQIWVSMIANLLLSVIKSRIKRSWSFSNMASIIRQHLMNYINIYKFLNDPEKAWISIVEKKKTEYQNSLFPKLAGAYF
ncbi:MAG: IS4 family transposase [Chlorobi bacterium]|nr:IS4 family transposase [Chlorobiota bacterium]